MENGSKSTIIAESGDKSLKNILERLASKSKINYKNFDIYFFVEHSDDTKDELEDMDNAIGIETQLKFLNNFELDLYYKKFPDAPESKPYSSQMSHLVNYKEQSNTYQNNKLKQEEEDQGREYIFNDISAGVYQVLYILMYFIGV